MYMQKVGRMTRSRFVVGESTYLEILKDRLKNEEKGFIRKHIRQKIKQVGVPVPVPSSAAG